MLHLIIIIPINFLICVKKGGTFFDLKFIIGQNFQKH